MSYGGQSRALSVIFGCVAGPAAFVLMGTAAVTLVNISEQASITPLNIQLVHQAEDYVSKHADVVNPGSLSNVSLNDKGDGGTFNVSSKDGKITYTFTAACQTVPTPKGHSEYEVDISCRFTPPPQLSLKA